MIITRDTKATFLVGKVCLNRASSLIVPSFGTVLTRTQSPFVWSEFMLPSQRSVLHPFLEHCALRNMILSARCFFFPPGVYAPNMSIATCTYSPCLRNCLIIIVQTSVANVHSKSQSSSSSLRHILLFHSLPLGSQVYSLRQWFHRCDKDSSSFLALVHI